METETNKKEGRVMANKIKISISQSTVIRDMNAGWILCSTDCRFGKVWLQLGDKKLPVLQKSFDCLVTKGAIEFLGKLSSVTVYKLAKELQNF